MVLINFSCEKDKVNSSPYFVFDNFAKQWFSELKAHDTIKFLSNFGNVRIYEVNAIENSKVVISGNCGTISAICTVFYRFDKRQIYVNRIDSFSIPSGIEMGMYVPDGLDVENLPKNVVATARIYGTFDDYNGQTLLFPNIYQTVSFSTFSNSLKTYSEVIKFNSNNPNPFYDPRWNINSNVNEVWYDRKFGFVYFKDIYGQEWKRQN